MNRTQTALWAPLFCKICQRRAAVLIGTVLMCGDCFFKHSVTEFADAHPEPLPAERVGSAHAQK